MSGMECSLDSSVFHALIYTNQIPMLDPNQMAPHAPSVCLPNSTSIRNRIKYTVNQLEGLWAYAYPHPGLLAWGLNKPVQAKPHYSMLATSNLVYTSVSYVGVISSTYSQHPSVTVTTMWTVPSRSLHVEYLVCPRYQRHFSLCCLLHLNTSASAYSGSLWDQVEDFLYLT